jgi:hypothetical protein
LFLRQRQEAQKVLTEGRRRRACHVHPKPLAVVFLTMFWTGEMACFSMARSLNRLAITLIREYDTRRTTGLRAARIP